MLKILIAAVAGAIGSGISQLFKDMELMFTENSGTISEALDQKKRDIIKDHIKTALNYVSGKIEQSCNDDVRVGKQITSSDDDNSSNHQDFIK